MSSSSPESKAPGAPAMSVSPPVPPTLPAVDPAAVAVASTGDFSPLLQQVNDMGSKLKSGTRQVKKAFEEFGFSALHLEFDPSYSGKIDHQANAELGPYSKRKEEVGRLRARFEKIKGFFSSDDYFEMCLIFREPDEESQKIAKAANLGYSGRKYKPIDASYQKDPANQMIIQCRRVSLADGTSSSQLTVRNSLIGLNVDRTLRALQLMNQLLEKNGDPNLVFDLGNLSSPAHKESLEVFRKAFQQDKTGLLKNRLSKADRELIFPPAATAEFKDVTRPAAVASPAKPLLSDSPPTTPASLASGPKIPEPAKSESECFLNETQMPAILKAVIGKVDWNQRESSAVGGLEDVYVSTTNANQMIFAQPRTIEEFFQTLKSVNLQVGQSFSGCLHVDGKHYCAIKVSCDVSGKVSAHVVESMGDARSRAPVVEENLEKFVREQTHVFRSVGAVTTERGPQQADGFTCGIYAIRSAAALAEMDLRVAGLDGLRGFTSAAADASAAKASAYKTLEKFASELSSAEDVELREHWKAKLMPHDPGPGVEFD